ncbi:MAG: hypothetical protein RJA69_436 [Pseudomonadota bacterium]|jgi:hypothetical protein
MNWEVKARVLANDLSLVAWWLLTMSVWLMVEVEGWAVVLPVLGALGAVNALRGARITP